MTEHGTDLTGDFAHRGGAALVVGGTGRLERRYVASLRCGVLMLRLRTAPIGPRRSRWLQTSASGGEEPGRWGSSSRTRLAALRRSRQHRGNPRWQRGGDRGRGRLFPGIAASRIHHRPTSPHRGWACGTGIGSGRRCRSHASCGVPLRSQRGAVPDGGRVPPPSRARPCRRSRRPGHRSGEADQR